MRNRFILLVSAVLLAACGGTGGTASTSPSSTSLSGYINVFAAASLTASFKALGTSFHQANPGVGVNFNFAGTPTLVAQIELGAPADVFASADTTNMDKLTADGYSGGTSKVFARNQLEIVVAPGNPKGITGLADLAKSGVIYISEAPTVPAGKYSLQALASAGVKVTPKSLETSVTAVISTRTLPAGRALRIRAACAPLYLTPSSNQAKHMRTRQRCLTDGDQGCRADPREHELSTAVQELARGRGRQLAELLLDLCLLGRGGGRVQRCEQLGES